MKNAAISDCILKSPVGNKWFFIFSKYEYPAHNYEDL